MSVEARNEIKQGAIKHLIRLVFQRVIGVCLFCIVAVWIRTYLEDKMLKDELAGYLEYSQKTRYRLIPFIW